MKRPTPEQFPPAVRTWKVGFATTTYHYVVIEGDDLDSAYEEWCATGKCVSSGMLDGSNEDTEQVWTEEIK